MHTPTEEIIDQFWENHEVAIGSEKAMFIAKMRFLFENRIFDTVLFDEERMIGYANIYKDERGWYDLSVADCGWKCHPGLQDKFGWGVEVHEDYQERNIGHALLSLGIGFAQRDFRQNGGMKDFTVRASGLGDKEGFYKQFGFETKSRDLGGKKLHITGVYRKLNVPPINIEDK